MNRLFLSCCALLALSCGSEPEGPPESGSSALELVVSVRSMSALGTDAGECSGNLEEEGSNWWEFTLPLDGDVTTGLFTGLEAGSPDLTVFIWDAGGLEILAEGSAGIGLQDGDTLQVGIRAFCDRTSMEYGLEMEPGGPWIPGHPGTILFVGNSYTFANGGLDSIFTEFCASASPGWEMTADMYAVGGYTLQDHYGDPSCIGMISRGDWDLVVLQEQSTRPLEAPDLMWQYAALLADVIEGAGARPGFFMTWAREYDPSMIDSLSWAYSHAGAMVDGMVSPVGLAWADVRREAPGLDLYEEDGSHPNLAGTYLVVCTMYAAITGESPVGVEYCCDPALTPGDRLLLQEAAWDAVTEYGQVDWRHF